MSKRNRKKISDWRFFHLPKYSSRGTTDHRCTSLFEWKTKWTEMEITQNKKIHRHGYKFSIDFLIHTLGYGFFGNHKHLAKVSRLLVPQFLKFIGLYGFFYGFFLFLMCFIYVLFIVITNLKFYKRCFIKDDLQKHFFYHRKVPCALKKSIS
jgi:hypothetical protein